MDRDSETKLKRLTKGVSVGCAAAIGLAAIWAGGHDLRPEALLRADLLSLLEARSPGGRMGGVSAKSKPRRALTPTERVLSGSRTRPAATAAPAAVAAPPVLLPGAAPLAPAVTDVLTAGAPVQTLGGAPVGLLPAAPAIFGGGGGAGGGGGGIGGTPAPGGPGGGLPGAEVPPTVVAPAVPEPATWMMLLIGFGLTGWSMRTTKSHRMLGRRASRGDVDPA